MIKNMVDIFYERIQNNDELKYILDNDPDKKYRCCKGLKCSGFNIIQKSILKVSKYPFLNDFINIYLQLHPGIVDHKNYYGWTALILASINTKTFCNEDTVKILLMNGSNPNIKHCYYGHTALSYACNNSNKNSSVGTVEMLLKFGADPNTQDTFARTPLIKSCNTRYSNRKTVEILLKYGANINVQDNNGYTALISSCKTNIWNKYGRTLLKYSNEKVLDLKDSYDYTVLAYVITFNMKLTIGEILEKYISAKNLCKISNKKRRKLINILTSKNNSKYQSVINALESGCYYFDYGRERIISNRKYFCKLKSKPIELKLKKKYSRFFSVKNLDLKFNIIDIDLVNFESLLKCF